MGPGWKLMMGNKIVQVRAGKDTFHALYYKDGIHPSAVGTYLESCVITSVISGVPYTTPDACSYYPQISIFWPLWPIECMECLTCFRTSLA